MTRARSAPIAPDLLERAPLSDGVRALARRGDLRRYPKGALLIHEGDFGDTLYVVLEGRLRALLEGLAAPAPDGPRRVVEALTHQELANRAGCSREMVTRQLRDLQQGGYVSVEQGRITLLKELPPRW